VAKEELRQMYAAGSLPWATRHLDSFYDLARRVGVPEVSRLARTVRRWAAQILSFFTTGRTNAKSEARNLITEMLRRNAQGMRHFDNYRLTLRPLLESGAADRIRGR